MVNCPFGFVLQLILASLKNLETNDEMNTYWSFFKQKIGKLTLNLIEIKWI